MTLSRREFLQALAAAAAASLPLASRPQDETFYDLPRFGNVSLLHFTDCHAQLLPAHFREPSVNLGVAASANRPPHLVGEALLKHFRLRPGSREAHAFTHLDFAQAGNQCRPTQSPREPARVPQCHRRGCRCGLAARLA